MKSGKFAPRPNPIRQPMLRPTGLTNAVMTPNQATGSANAWLLAAGFDVVTGLPPKPRERKPRKAREPRERQPRRPSKVITVTIDPE